MQVCVIGGGTINRKNDFISPNKGGSRRCFATKVSNQTTDYQLPYSPRLQDIPQGGLVECIILGLFKNYAAVSVQALRDPTQRVVPINQVLPPTPHHTGVIWGVDMPREDDWLLGSFECLFQRLDCWNNRRPARHEGMR